MQYKVVGTYTASCANRDQRIAFVERFLNIPPNKNGGHAYWPIFRSHGGGYVEARENKDNSISYFHEGKVLRKERRRVCDTHEGAMEFCFWITTKFTFCKNEAVVEEAESSSHIDGTDEDYPDTSNDNFGSQGFGRWNDNSTGIWDWD